MLQFIWVLLYNYTSGIDDVPALPLPPGVQCTMDSRFNYLTFCLFLLPCVNSVVEAWPVCIGGLGEERGLQELVNVNTSSATKTCNLTPSDTGSIPVYSVCISFPFPHPLWVPKGLDSYYVHHTTLGWLPMSLLLAVSYAKRLGIPNNRKKLKIYFVSPASKIKVTAHRNLQIVSPKTNPF